MCSMLTLEKIRSFCYVKKGVSEDFPFDFSTLVFKVADKIFALTDTESDQLWINLKCDPFLSLDLREKYDAISPGYHMNKKHWNTIIIDGTIPDDEILRLIDHSYELVYDKLPKRIKDHL